MPKGKRTKKLTVDFSGVEAGGIKVEDGVYTVKVEKVAQDESSSGNPMLKLEYRIEGPKSKGAKLYDNLSLLPQSLWKLRGFLQCLGVEVEDGPTEMETDDWVGEELNVEVTNEKYEGKDRPKVTGYQEPGEVSTNKDEEDSDEEDEEDEDEDDEEEDEDEEDEEEDDEDEEEEPPAKSKKAKAKPTAAGKLSIGDKVSFEDDEGDKHKGKITEIEGKKASVKVGSDDWEIEVKDLTKI